jgi:hypothetical protein
MIDPTVPVIVNTSRRNKIEVADICGSSGPIYIFIQKEMQVFQYEKFMFWFFYWSFLYVGNSFSKRYLLE